MKNLKSTSTSILLIMAFFPSGFNLQAQEGYPTLQIGQMAPLPYVYDGKTQEMLKKYGPVATPHFFIFDQERKLRFAGRIDDSEEGIRPETKQDTRNALEELLAGKQVTVEKTKTFGCSVKWSDKREAAKKSFERILQEEVKLGEISVEGVEALVQIKPEKLTLINVWATWCGPCVTEFPDLVEIGLMYRNRPGKQDYNFIADKNMYDGTDWSQREPGQPFFAQVQIFGPHREFRRDPQNPVNADSVVLPPYYPDHPLARQDWALYLENIQIVDRIRCVRTSRYKYIRNFYPDRPYTQFNAYKKHQYPVLTLMQVMDEAGELDSIQTRFMATGRPAEELYDLENDPFEINNLASTDDYKGVLDELRSRLDEWLEVYDIADYPEDPMEIAYWEEFMKENFRERMDSRG